MSASVAIHRPADLDDGLASRLEVGLRRAGRLVDILGWELDIVEITQRLPVDHPRLPFLVGRLQVIQGLADAVAGGT